MLPMLLLMTAVLGADAESVIAALPVPEDAQAVERTKTSDGGSPALTFRFVAKGERDAVQAYYGDRLREAGWLACSGGNAGKWYRGADSRQGPARPFQGRTTYWVAADGETVLSVTLVVRDDANVGEHAGENQEVRIAAIGPKETAAMLVREYGLNLLALEIKARIGLASSTSTLDIGLGDCYLIASNLPGRSLSRLSLLRKDRNPLGSAPQHLSGFHP